MAESKGSQKKKSDAEGMPALVNELLQLVIAYVKQETLDPLKSLARVVAFGLLGSVCMALGTSLLALGVLRLVQDLAGHHLSGDLSWVPYLGAIAFCALVAVMAALRIGKVDAMEHR